MMRALRYMTLGTLSLCVSLSLGCDDKGGEPGEAEAESGAEAGAEAESGGEGEGDGADEVGDDGAGPGEGAVEARVDLEAIAGLVSSDATIKTGAELEAVINDSRRGLHSIDVDADGQVDYIRTFELRSDGAIRLELQAIPSSTLKVEDAVKVATIALEPAPADGAVEFSADAEFEGEAVASAELPLISWSFDAERPVYEGSFALKAELDPADFQLSAVADAITSAEVKTAAELEAKLNAPDAPLVKVDVDADGTLDHVQVVELRADAEADAELEGAVAFDLRAVPSSVDAQFAVSLGSVVFTSAELEAEAGAEADVEAGAAVEMTASYSNFFSASADTSITHEWKVTADADASADAEVGMHAWVLTEERPVYYSAYVRADGEAFIPPGHAKHGHWKAQGASGEAKAKITVKTKARPSGKGKVKVKHKAKAKASYGGIFGKHKKSKKHKKHKKHKKSKRSGGLFGKKKSKKSAGKPKKHKKHKSHKKSKSRGKKKKRK